MKEVTEADWIEIDEALVTNKPFLTQYDIDMTSGVVGLTYAVRVTVENKVGLATSDSVVFLLADVPG
jgi:hypothetical protein